MASPSPGPGYVWITDGSSGSDPSSGGGGYWAPNPYASLNEQAAPAANMVGGASSAEAINANWQMSQPLQNQFANLLINPVSGYSPQANYGAQLGRFQFSNTAPVPQTAPVGWGRYPGVGGAPPPAPWVRPTVPTVPTNPANPPVTPPSPPVTPPSPPVTPPTTGGPPPGGVYNPTGAWTGAGLPPSSRAAHEALRRSQQAARAAGENIAPNTTPIDTAAVLAKLGYTNPNVWTSSAYKDTNYNGPELQWSPGDFANTGPGSLSAWQQNWNALPPALRVAYGEVLGNGGTQVLKDIYGSEGASLAAQRSLSNALTQANGVVYAVENGQLVEKRANSQGQWTTTPLANLLNPNAPRILSMSDTARRGLLASNRALQNEVPTFEVP